ncbi:uncharacterized protein YhaN [Kineococcus xinjiangensis]|uniref:Uncharacterized protein YhaN n=1 Tax=Kineococcus xinjiangensis TaxID=512762 RepID=A0A2S6ITR3_9ACTN|nr:AAA family ATPase [Kineococcus xinjiangensis]PPK97642.1 uncharacterized protein YhaN [Kineococcus xinjiangensis]
MSVPESTRPAAGSAAAAPGHLAEVRLERYGAFTGAAVELPARVTVVAGPNEAGKSTLLAAVGDLLWGIEARPRYAFEHARQALRLSARWCGPGGELEVARTARGLHRADAGPDAGPLDPPWGGATDRAGWEQRLGLSHEQLREGGRAVLTGGGDLAALVFTAHHGSGLREVLAALEAEAERLWKPRGTRVVVRERAAALAQARADLAAAETRAGLVAQARERSTAAATAAAHADAAVRAARRSAGAAAAEARDLPRVREVLRLRDTRARLLAEGPLLLGPDLLAHADATARRQQAQAELAELAEEAERLRAQRARCSVDEPLLAAAAEVEELRDAAEARALEEEQAAAAAAEADAAEAQARQRLRELGVDGDAPLAALLARVEVPADVAADLTALGQRCTELAGRADHLAEALAQARAAEHEEAAAGTGPDEAAVVALGDLVSTLTREGSAAAQWRAALTERDAQAALARRAAATAGALDPAAAVPGLDAGEVRREHALLAAARRRAEDAAAEARRCAVEVEDATTALAASDRGSAPTYEDLRAARQARDAAWGPLASHGIVMAEEAEALGRALAHLDSVTDALLADADAAARHELCRRRLAAARAEAAEAGAAQERAEAECSGLEAAWARRWAGAGLSLPADEEVPDVLRALGEAREAAAAATAAEQRASALRGDVDAQRLQLLAVLRSCGDSPDGHPEGAGSAPDLDTALVRAQRVLATADEAREQRALARERGFARRRAEERWRAAAEELAGAESAWERAAAAAGLPPAVRPPGWAQRLRVLEAAAAATARAGQQRDLSRRLAERVARFEEQVGELAARLSTGTGADTDTGFDTGTDTRADAGAGAPAGARARAVVAELSHRLSDSRADARVAADLDERLAARAQDQAAAAAALAAADADLTGLLGAARSLREGAGPAAVELDGTAALAGAAERGEQAQRLQEAESALLTRLAEDHPDVEGLLHRLRERDDVDVRTDAEQLGAAREEAEEAYTAAQQELGSARAEVARLEGAGDANVLAARAAEALAALAEATERYVVVDLQRRLLREQLEEFAARRANPLLEEAGKLLTALTDGRWTGLSAGDDGGQRQLLVHRGDGLEAVAGQGLSEGTADQVFLALRLAAIAQQHRGWRAAGAAGLPVVLDDVLMTFDEHRVAAALRVLRSLGEDLQVVLLTHHLHVADAALALGEGVAVTSLPGPGRLSRDGATPPAPRRESGGAGVEAQLVRTWARQQGIEVSASGRVAGEVVRRYKEAHGLG